MVGNWASILYDVLVMTPWLSARSTSVIRMVKSLAVSEPEILNSKLYSGPLSGSSWLSAVCVINAPPAVSLYPSSEKISIEGVVLRYSLTSIFTVYKPGTSEGLV